MTTHALPHHAAPLSPELRKGIRARFAQLASQLVITGIVMFLCAGSMTWARGWLNLVVAATSMAALGVWVIPRNPEVIAERSRLHEDTATFDKVIVPIYTVLTGAIYVVGALDNGRYGWAPLSWTWSIVGVVLLLLSVVPVASAMVENRRLATTVRIEKEQQHELATEGAYRVVRHPMYAGSLVQFPAIALVLGSIWALLPAAAAIVCIIVRTALEDRWLHRELRGYEAYAQRTRYRLIPGLW